MTQGDDRFRELVGRLQRSDGDEALALVTDAVNAHPQDARLLHLLAAEFAGRGDFDRAEGTFTALLAVAPQYAIARFQLGLLQFTLGRPAVAATTWAPLDLLHEDDPLRMFKQAFDCLATDDLDAAQGLLERGMAANSANAPLNRDMQLVVDRIVAARGTKNAPAGPADEHFLLSTYKSVH